LSFFVHGWKGSARVLYKLPSPLINIFAYFFSISKIKINFGREKVKNTEELKEAVDEATQGGESIALIIASGVAGIPPPGQQSNN